MPFPWTLQRYIFKEMGKTFLLSTVGLTGVVGLGGGVLNMIKVGEVTPEQFVRLMLIILPLSAALTLPIASLFSAASTYGRLSADNEFVACRSSGINIHVLFFPTVILSLFSAAVTFVFINFVIPDMARNLERFVGADFGTAIQQRLNRPEGLSLGNKLRIAADNTVVDASNPDRIDLNRIAFVQMEAGEWIRYGVARQASLQFERGEGTISVVGRLRDLSLYDIRDGRFVESGEWELKPNVLPEDLLLAKLKFLSLGGLLHYWRNPDEWREVRDELDKLRLGVAQLMVYDRLWDDWEKDHELVLGDGDTRYLLHAETGGRTKRDKLIELQGVSMQEIRGDRRRRIFADRVGFELDEVPGLGDVGLYIHLYDAQLYDEAADDSIPVAKPKETLGPVALDPSIKSELEHLSVDALLRPDMTGETREINQSREEFSEIRAETIRKIAGVIHERMSFSASVLVLIILGAALGIVFRGSHVLTAFGISFVPVLFVIITIVTGKQLAHNPGTSWLGLMTMWSGIFVVALLDVWTLTRVLRR
jgi:lipopolysaccharide export LptBFGC system permease protein LptF